MSVASPTTSAEPVEVVVDRRKAAGWALFAAVFVWSGAGWMVVHGSIPGLIVALIMAPVAWTNARDAYAGKVKLVIDTEGMTFVRRGMSVAWRDVRAVRIQEQQGFLDLDRDLIVTLDPRLFPEPSPAAPRREIDVPLRGVRPSPDVIADAIEARCDLAVERPHRRRRFMRWEHIDR